MRSRGRVPDRKRQRTVDDSSDDDEVSDAVKAVIDEELDDADEDNENENEAGDNSEELQDLEDEEEDEEEEEAEDEEDEEEEESGDENEPEVENVDEAEVEDDDDGVNDNEELVNDNEELDDDSEQPDDEYELLDSAGPSRRMTARQRNKQLGTTASIGVVDLDDLEGSNRAKKKALSAEEQRIKRAEMARRRRNLSQKRLEEEKQDTLDKLLKKRAGKVRGETDEQGEPTSRRLRSKLAPPHPAFLSWRSSKDGFTLSMTEERAKKENLA